MAKRKIACALSVAALTLGSGVLSPAVFADGEACEATNLETLKACLASSSEIINATETVVLNGEGVDETLAINNKTINGVPTKNVFHIENGAKLTLTGNGVINAGRYGAIADGAEFVINGVTINAISDQSYGVFAKNNGKVTINSGRVVADYAAFAGNNTTGNMNFYVNGGTLKSNRYPAIYMPGQVDLVVTGGTLDGGIMARMGQIEISGGTINAQDAEVVTNTDDGLAKNYGGMASMYEAVALVGGSYQSTTTSHGNDMNVIISGGIINGEVALYDMGNTAAGYAQNIKVNITGGAFDKFSTKFTNEEIGFTPKSGYTAGFNNAAGRVEIDIVGGDYATEPAEEDIRAGHEAELDEETNTYKIFPKEVEYGDDYIEDGGGEEGHVSVSVEFGKSLVADRRAVLSAVEYATDGLSLDGSKGGDLIGAVDIKMLKRDGVTEISVENNDLLIYIDIDPETHAKLAEYDKLYAVYFEGGEEVDRFEITLSDPNDGYYMVFRTPHLSVYGVVGVNDDVEEATADAPETGTMTVMGASATSAAGVAVIAAGVLATIAGVAYLIRRKG